MLRIEPLEDCIMFRVVKGTGVIRLLLHCAVIETPLGWKAHLIYS